MKILRQPPVAYARLPLRVAVVTGLSNPASCELTQPQRDLIALPELPVDSVIGWNFPFIPESPATQTSEPSLLKASLSNCLHFVRTYAAGYQRLATPHWEALLSATDRVIMVTGSCGLQLINTSDYLREHSFRIRILAFGPVANAQPRFSTTLLQGSRDYLSKLWFRKADITIPGVGHMDYWTHPKVREVATQWLRDKISE